MLDEIKTLAYTVAALFNKAGFAVQVTAVVIERCNVLYQVFSNRPRFIAEECHEFVRQFDMPCTSSAFSTKITQSR